MDILINSSKTMHFPALGDFKFTEPIFFNQTKKLISKYSKFSIKSLMDEMKVSNNIAKKTQDQFKNFSFSQNIENSSPSIFAFCGSIFRDITPSRYSIKDIQFAQKNLIILSGLYGILRPMDLIQPYRLEMDSTRSFWKNKITNFIDNRNNGLILNLASKEYFSVLKNTKNQVYHVRFLEKKNMKPVTIYSKFARGNMVNWLIKNKVESIDKIKEFSGLGYIFSNSLSTNTELVFLR